MKVTTADCEAMDDLEPNDAQSLHASLPEAREIIVLEKTLYLPKEFYNDDMDRQQAKRKVSRLHRNPPNAGFDQAVGDDESV